jgi:hypothetical protein
VLQEQQMIPQGTVGFVSPSKHVRFIRELLADERVLRKGSPIFKMAMEQLQRFRQDCVYSVR